MEWTIGWRPRWPGEVETVELASITRPALAAAADAVGLSFEETRPLLDGAHPFYACGRFGISRRSPARSKSGDAQPGSVRWLGGVTEQPAGLVAHPVDRGWQEKSACDGHWQW